MSTSYSGTVLGIDLDMQHDFRHSARRSVTPVWFSPKEPEKIEEPLKSALQPEGAKLLRPRLITSSALTCLLPVAAAEGIVQQKADTPQLAFYSPSGNMIQAQPASHMPACTSRSSSRSRPQSESNFPGTLIPGTSYYNGTTLPSALSALSAAVPNPPARLTDLPSTAPPRRIAQLPEHLRHHHNHHMLDKSSVGSACDPGMILSPRVLMITDPQVLGCGGMTRPSNLDPHGSVLQYPPKYSKIKHSMSCLRMRANRLAIDDSSWLMPNSSSKRRRAPARKLQKKGKILQKRRVPHDNEVLDKDVMGPALGHALRVCFCQPYDGVGRQAAGADCGAAATMQPGERLDDPHASTTDSREPTPIARTTAGANRRGKSRARRDSAVGIGSEGRQSGGGTSDALSPQMPGESCSAGVSYSS